ncbi:hypothetical protein [uncultured Nostoc sp.]|nr:hypothetical protein [uncultured Nostoc sp.]
MSRLISLLMRYCSPSARSDRFHETGLIATHPQLANKSIVWAV